MTEQPIAIIPAADFLFLARFASSEETRYYLRGIAIQPSQAAGGTVAGGVTMVATDGHRMGILRQRSEEAWQASPGFILATDPVLMRACKPGKKDHATLVCYADRVDVLVSPAYASVPEISEILAGTYARPVALSMPAESLYIDGAYPDWRRILPPADRKVSGRRETKRGDGSASCVGLDAEYLASFAAPKKTRDDPAAIAFDWDGENAIIVTNTDPRFIGVCMPMRNSCGAAEIAARRAAVLDGVVIEIPAGDKAEAAA